MSNILTVTYQNTPIINKKEIEGNATVSYKGSIVQTIISEDGEVKLNTKDKCASDFIIIAGEKLNTKNKLITDFIRVEVKVDSSWLCFTAEQANSTIKMAKNGTPTKGQAFETSFDGITWQVFTPGTTTITLANIGDKVYFRGDNTTVSESESIYYQYVMTGRIAASGNIMSLLGKTSSAPVFCFCNMFNNCTSLTTAPELPATKLTRYCYYKMFMGCTSLTTAPALPATTLEPYCCEYMFMGCTSLTTAPALPATLLAPYCYKHMFYQCTSLTTAPALPATMLSDYCYQNMFQSCTALTTAPTLPATKLMNCCYQHMFDNCTSLTTAPTLPATTLAPYCYDYMFRDCTALTTAPNLPATTLASECYRGMFSGCTSLYVSDTSGPGYTNKWRIPTSGTGLGTYAMHYMFTNCSGTRSTDTPKFDGTQGIYYTQNVPV